MKALSYKGYAARVEYDPEDEILVGHIAGTRDVIGFHAETASELKAAFREAVDDYLRTCAQAGKTPDKPYSGQLMVRVGKDVHARAAMAAEISDKSLAKWAEDVIDRAARQTLESTVLA